MGPLVQANELSKALIEAANNLLKPHSSTDAILILLDEIESLLSAVEQDPVAALQNALLPSMKALVSADLLRNPDSDVRVFVVSCLTEIMRITAPEAPYNDDQMKEIFQVTIEAFGKLADASCRGYRKAKAVLETVSKVRSSLVMLDLECDDLVLEMFRQFLKIISPDHPELVLHSMETVMVTVIDESEEVSMDLLEILLNAVRRGNQDVSPTASRLVEKVLSSCARKLQPCIMGALTFKGTSLDMYSPVVLSICQSESATTQTHNVVKAKENEAEEKVLAKEAVPSEDKLDLALSRKGNRSKRTARSGTSRVSGDDRSRTGNDLTPFLKQGQSESTDAETESGSARKRGRKPNSLMNPEEGYSFKTSSGNKMRGKELGVSSLGKLGAKKASLPTKVGQTNQPVVVSLSSSGRARNGSRKRSRTKREETSNDVGSIVTPTSKKQIVKKENPEEEDFMESNHEKPEDGIKTVESSIKQRAQNGLVKTSTKKPLAETKMAKTSGKKSVHSDAKKKNSEGASIDMPIPQSSKSKKKNPRATTPSTKTPKRKRTAGEEVKSNAHENGEELVGKKVKVWWPLDNKFYEGVIESYCSSKKMHRVSYTDGDDEELDLKGERFEIIQDNCSASEDKEIDMPESIPLADLIRRQKVKKSKKLSVKVEPSSSPEVRSSIRTMKKKDSVADFIKQVKRTKGAGNEPESRDGKNHKSLKELNGEPGKTKGGTGKKQMVAQAKSEKDRDEKEDPEIKGEDILKFGSSNSEPGRMGEQEVSPKKQNAEIQTDREEHNSLKESNAEPKTDGGDEDAGKESTAEPKTEGEEADAEPEANVEEKESAKEQTAIENEDMTEAKGEKTDKETYTSMPETGKVENEAEYESVIKESKEESDKAEVGTIHGSD